MTFGKTFLKEMQNMIKILEDICAIKSPTFSEQEIAKYLKERFQKLSPAPEIKEYKDSLLIHFPKKTNLKNLVLVGHTDVVPEHFTPYIQDNQFHGSGASDMKAALAAYIHLCENHLHDVLQHHNLSLIFYSREEGTKMEENGLYDLIQKFPDDFQKMDLAIVGEPTDNTIQIGCVGSLHATLTIKGLACHSARPWNGENAIYKALPILQKFSQLKPVKYQIFGVDFFDVISITESGSDKGRTTIPGTWTANVNFRFAPNKNSEQAQIHLEKLFEEFGLQKSEYTIDDISNSGQVIENEIFKSLTKKLGFPIQAKQAWTDVAQLTQNGIAAFNFGPGLTSQAHKENEYILIDMYEDHIHHLVKTLTSPLSS